MPKRQEQKYCDCLKSVEAKGTAQNPYAVCTHSVYQTRGLKRPRISCTKETHSPPVIVAKTHRIGPNRKAPIDSSTIYSVGTRRKGLDGTWWKVIETQNGLKKWVRHKTYRTK